MGPRSPRGNRGSCRAPCRSHRSWASLLKQWGVSPFLLADSLFSYIYCHRISRPHPLSRSTSRLMFLGLSLDRHDQALISPAASACQIRPLRRLPPPNGPPDHPGYPDPLAQLPGLRRHLAKALRLSLRRGPGCPILPLYFVRVVGASDANIGVINMTFTFFMLGGYLLWPWVSRRRADASSCWRPRSAWCSTRS